MKAFRKKVSTFHCLGNDGFILTTPALGGDGEETNTDQCVAPVTEGGTNAGTWVAGRQFLVTVRGYARHYSLTQAHGSLETIDVMCSVDPCLCQQMGEAKSGAALHENDGVDRPSRCDPARYQSWAPPLAGAQAPCSEQCPASG